MKAPPLTPPTRVVISARTRAGAGQSGTMNGIGSVVTLGSDLALPMGTERGEQRFHVRRHRHRPA